MSMPDIPCQRIMYNTPSPEVYRHSRRPSYEVYDLNESSTFTTPAPRHHHHHQQPPHQQPQPQPQPAPRPASTHSAESRPTSASGGPRYLRRARRTPEPRQLPHRRAVSLDTSTRQSRQQQQQPAQPQPAQSIPVSAQPTPESGIEALRPALSEAHTDENGSTVDDPYQLLDSSYWPWRTTAVSSRTASAILYALEDAIRRPFTFTNDWDEVNASMSDMVGVAGPAGPAGPVGNGRAQNGASRAPQPPAPISTHPPSGVRTPTDIMRQRRDREARRKAEQEAREKEQVDLERQQLEQEQSQAQAQAQAQQYAAGAAADPASQRRTQPPRAPRGAQPPPEAASGPSFRPGAAAASGTAGPGYQVPPATADVPPQARPGPSSSQQQFAPAPQHTRSQSAAAGTSGQTGTGGLSRPGQTPASQSGAPQSLQQPKRAGFPHAFERWETLSSHWEGLTSYWIRKLEQHNDDLEKDPLSQQLARQITDLSAAGANLFHAVVELQRLRASSERKFQRWFFDTRSEQERAKEQVADLERQLKTERQGQADAFAAAQTAEQDKSRSEELLREMRRELQISREEARRAWEELGRREQEERDRTNSLRNGEPTLVGGVQVVPMVQGLPSRHTTRPTTRDDPYATGPPASEYQNKPTDPSASHQYYDEVPEPMSPTGSDPFIEPVKTDPPSNKPLYAEQAYKHDPTSAAYHGAGAAPSSEPDDRSYVGSSEAGDEDYAHYPQPHGAMAFPPPAPLSEGSDDYDDGGHYTTDAPYSSAPAEAPMQAPYPPTTADYSGAGWGVGTGWESVTPRHRHPTRLSDVLEEDEPSRTSPSRASQASRASRSQAGRSQAGRSVQ
ncbi:hypothetical protein N7509_005151 [Penicillium cosmopolitanum]|uniref:Uncharacterized protein n=1 Tax=Penicillium cosmopolitanum TaxID=1131564 RepID=A0A9X0B9S3_9EURO|nr:uncharacterized protein N7509_005151 [Penicillium cosmopolitanum]KAJ5397038.1 hypothetical protein N7509_005151 [Penicillium cosmopolitanum]